MVIVGIALLIMGLGCTAIALYMRHIFNGEELEYITVEGKILEYAHHSGHGDGEDDKPGPLYPVVSFQWGENEIQAYADSVPRKNRPEIGSSVKLGVRRAPIPGDENRWDAYIIPEEERKGLPLSQVLYYVLIIVSATLIIAGAVMCFLG